MISFEMYTKYIIIFICTFHVTTWQHDYIKSRFKQAILSSDRSPQMNLQILYRLLTYAANTLHDPKYSYFVQLHQQGKLNDLSLLEAEVLQVHAPPFVSKETNSSQSIGPAFSRVQRRRSFIKKVN